MMDFMLSIHIAAITSMFISGIFILSMRGVRQPMIYMTIYRFFTTLVFIINFFQTYGSPVSGQTIWNPLHLIALLAGYPLLFAYMFTLMRPGSAGFRYWALSFVPPVTLLFLHLLFGAVRGPLPLFEHYADLRRYLSEPGLWVYFAAVVIFVAQLSICTPFTIRLLRQHRRNLLSVFSYTEGVMLRWMWWNIALTVFNGIVVLLVISVEGQLFKFVCIIIFIVEPVISTIWVLRQKDLYGEPVQNESGEETLFDKENGGVEFLQERRKKLKHNLLELLEKEEIFMDSELNSEKVREMLSTNRTYLSRVINQDMNTTFYQLINTYRLNKAMNMMKNHPHRQIQLKYIAETCGFKSMSAFSNLFKQTYGKTPTEWLNHPSPTAKKKDG